jgi:hypothetical protein
VGRYLLISGYPVGLPLEVLIIIAMLRGGYRRFPTAFAFYHSQLVTTVVEMPLALENCTRMIDTSATVTPPRIGWTMLFCNSCLLPLY